MATSVEIWPDNLRAFNVFQAMGTQWLTGMAGPTGLNYVAIPITLRLLGVPRVQWAQLFEDLRVMEAGALSAMHAKN